MYTGSRSRQKSRLPVLLLIAVALGCAVGALYRIRLKERAEEEIGQLRRKMNAEMVYVEVLDASEESEASAFKAQPPEPDTAEQETETNAADETASAHIRRLQTENAELCGWLSIEAAGVDYPVMYSPERPNYYIDHNFEGEKSASGLLYIDEDCDPVHGINRIVFGHNMNNGSMFGSLKRFLEPAFAAKYPVFTFDGINGRESYRILAAYETPIDADAPFRFYTYTNIASREEFDAYVDNAMAMSAIPAGEKPEWGDRLLTLVTCVHYKRDWRFVIVAAGQDALTGK